MSALAHAGTGEPISRNGGAYTGVLQSCLRIIATAEPGKELAVFDNQARELAGHVRAGGLELLPVVTALSDAGSKHVEPKHGHHAVQAALAQAFSNSLTLPEHQHTQASASGRRQRFALTRFADLKVNTAPAQLIRGLIPRVGLTVVWGPPKSGKSFVVFDAIMHVAMGEEYRGREVTYGPVVYCAFEGAEGYGKRAEAFRKHHHLDDDNDLPFYLVSARMDFVRDHPALIACIRSTLGSDEPVAVVLDTLNRSLPGSESSDQDMAAYIKAADAVRETFNCAVIIVHHCGIDNSRPRGHTSLTGAVDAQLAVKRDASDHITLEVEWMKDGPEGDVVASRLDAVEIGTDDDGYPITSCVVEPVDGSVVTTTSKPPRLSKAAQTALRALVEAVSECGVSPPASNHIPTRVRVVTVDQWRQYAYRMGISAADTTPRAKQKAFKSAVDTLISRQQIGVWDDQVWLAGQP
ncbi:MAG: AAA family ATPase [Pseudolabrys sp.]